MMDCNDIFRGMKGKWGDGWGIAPTEFEVFGPAPEKCPVCQSPLENREVTDSEVAEVEIFAGCDDCSLVWFVEKQATR